METEPARIGVGAVVAAFLCGLALAGGIGFYVNMTAAAVSAAASTRKFQSSAQSDLVSLALPGRLSLPIVRPDEIAEALETMNLSSEERKRIKDELAGGGRRLLWLTVWDWDTGAETGNTISIKSGGYKRVLTMSNRCQRIAIAEPRSGFVELRGEQSEDGIVAISLLSGVYPLAVPRMAPSQNIRVEIDPLPVAPN